MAKSKARLDLHFAALGDSTRRTFLNRLAQGKATVRELAAPHDMALPSFMGLLIKLEDAGLIVTVKEGRVRICELVPDTFSQAQDWLSEQNTIWNDRLHGLDDYVTILKQERNP